MRRLSVGRSSWMAWLSGGLLLQTSSCSLDTEYLTTELASYALELLLAALTA